MNARCSSTTTRTKRPSQAILAGIFACLSASACESDDQSNGDDPTTSASTSASTSSNSMTGSHDTSDTSNTSGLPALPEAINAFGATAIGSSIFVFGGNVGAAHNESNATTRADVRRLNLAEAMPQWMSVPANLEAVQQPTLSAYNNQILRIGGLAVRNAPDAAKDLHTLANVALFDPLAATWHDLSPLPLSRSSHSATVLTEGGIGQQVAVVGGWTLNGPAESGTYATTWALLDLATEGATWQEFPQPFSLRDHCAASVDGKVYVLGGMLSGTFPITPWILDPVTQTWSNGPDLPAKTPIGGFGCAATAIDNRLFVTLAEGLVYELNATRDGWLTLGSLHTPRAFHGLVATDSHTLVALGGGTGQELQPTAEVEWFAIPQ